LSGQNGNGRRSHTGSRTVILEPSDVLAAGLERVLLQNGFDVVGIARDPEAAMRLTDATSPDVVLVDVELPDMAGAQVRSDLMRTRPEMRVVGLVHAEDSGAALRARQAGFHGHISLRASGSEIARSIDRILTGQPRVVAQIAPSSESARADASWLLSKQLTEREREVLRLLAVGLRNDRIAEILFLSPHTVRTHVQNIRTKIGVRSRLEAAVFAIRTGLAEPGAKARSA
jgi:DNA-binding NarL/FixJ family response regulator